MTYVHLTDRAGDYDHGTFRGDTPRPGDCVTLGAEDYRVLFVGWLAHPGTGRIEPYAHLERIDE